MDDEAEAPVVGRLDSESQYQRPDTQALLDQEGTKQNIKPEEDFGDFSFFALLRLNHSVPPSSKLSSMETALREVKNTELSLPELPGVNSWVTER